MLLSVSYETENVLQWVTGPAFSRWEVRKKQYSHLVVAVWVVDAGDGVCGVEIVEGDGQER